MPPRGRCLGNRESRWGEEAAFTNASARAREAPPVLRRSMFFAWPRWWSGLIATSCWRAFAFSLVSHLGVDGVTPDLADLSCEKIGVGLWGFGFWGKRKDWKNSTSCGSIWLGGPSPVHHSPFPPPHSRCCQAVFCLSHAAPPLPFGPSKLPRGVFAVGGNCQRSTCLCWDSLVLRCAGVLCWYLSVLGVQVLTCVCVLGDRFRKTVPRQTCLGQFRFV